MTDAVRRTAKTLVFAASLSPLAFMLWDALAHPNAIYFNAIVRTTGFWSLRFACLALAVTPLRWLTGCHALVRFRRMLGLFAFFYGTLHTGAYVLFDRAAPSAAQTLSGIGEDLLRPFFYIGLLALLLMAPLAATSTVGMIQWLGGRRWQALHRLAYPAAVASVLHTYWPLPPRSERYIVILCIIFILRLARAIARIDSGRKTMWQGVSGFP